MTGNVRGGLEGCWSVKRYDEVKDDIHWVVVASQIEDDSWEEWKKFEENSGFAKELPHRFRMSDDDGMVYYRGRMSDTLYREDPFRPLDDYGMPNAGCVNIEIYNKEKREWEGV